jgi:hypothetical protein
MATRRGVEIQIEHGGWSQYFEDSFFLFSQPFLWTWTQILEKEKVKRKSTVGN